MNAAVSNRKIVVVAVHGIGDHVKYATVQQVAAQFTRFYDHPMAIPVGNFETTDAAKGGAYFPPGLSWIGFAEVYWADIAHKVGENGFILEETKAWATIVAKRASQRKHTPDSIVDYRLVGQVVGEMVETIGTLEDLTFLADKAGVGRFNLNKILVDYVDNVQLVAEFVRYRDEILARFRDVLAAVHQNCPEAEIYVVAHSEGTAISLLGLLDALWAETTPDWLKKVRGFMTFGSPINKHLVLWPDLFSRFESSGFQRYNPEPEIKWRNYYDYGDPVGFQLNIFADWMRENKVTAFEFESPESGKPDPHHDIGFARYPLPGEAHDDYWRDNEVFDHFIQSVVKQEQAVVPKSHWWIWVVSYIISYGVALALVVVAVFLLDRAMAAHNSVPPIVSQLAATLAPATQSPNTSSALQTSLQRFGDVLGVALLLGGVTVLARLPRLVNKKQLFKWSAIATGIFLLFAVLYGFLVLPQTQSGVGTLARYILGLLGLGASVADPSKKSWLLIWATILIAFAGAVASACLSRWKPRWGMRPLLVWGTATVIVTILEMLELPSMNSVWPVVLAGVALLYLWWLAGLFFDLVFVWHRYIRLDFTTAYLKSIRHSSPHGGN
jgi:hypothetical protein